MILGIDEVGRGPGAGPIVFCAFALLDENMRAEILTHFLKGLLRDSKKLSERKRGELSQYFHILKESGLVTWALSERSAEEIDKKGLSFCIKECLEESVEKIQRENNLSKKDIFLSLDGGLRVSKEYKQETIIKGDEKILEIACASIIAKVYRDDFMKKMGILFPEYYFEKNMGYLTREHRESIQKYRASPLHRKSFLKNIAK